VSHSTKRITVLKKFNLLKPRAKMPRKLTMNLLLLSFMVSRNTSKNTVLKKLRQRISRVKKPKNSNFLFLLSNCKLKLSINIGIAHKKSGFPKIKEKKLGKMTMRLPLLNWDGKLSIKIVLVLKR